MLELSLSVHVDVLGLPRGVAGPLHLQPLAASVHVPFKGHLKKEHKSRLLFQNHPLRPSDEIKKDTGTQPTPGGSGAWKALSEPVMAISSETQPRQCPWRLEGQCCVATHRSPEREDLTNSCHSSFPFCSVPKV